MVPRKPCHPVNLAEEVDAQESWDLRGRIESTSISPSELAFVHAVPPTHSDVRTRPDADTACDLSRHLETASQVDHSLVRKVKTYTEPTLLVCD